MCNGSIDIRPIKKKIKLSRRIEDALGSMVREGTCEQRHESIEGRGLFERRAVQAEAQRPGRPGAVARGQQRAGSQDVRLYSWCDEATGGSDVVEGPELTGLQVTRAGGQANSFCGRSSGLGGLVCRGLSPALPCWAAPSGLFTSTGLGVCAVKWAEGASARPRHPQRPRTLDLALSS